MCSWLSVFLVLVSAWLPRDDIGAWGFPPPPGDQPLRLHGGPAAAGPAIRNGHQQARQGLSPFLLIAERSATFDLPQTHWYEPPNPLGLEMFTRDTLPWMAKDAIGLRYTGPLRAPFAAQLRQVLLTSPQPYNHVMLELDSDGGELAYVMELVAVLKEVRTRMQLITRVTEGSLCASGCIPVFLQGEKRMASGSSIWVFHGARSAFTNIPDPSATDEYLDLLSAAGMTPAFRAILIEENRIYRPGSFILSGYELFTAYRSGIITELIPVWREEAPIMPSGLGPR